MDVSPKLIITKGDINNNTQLLTNSTLPQSTNKLHTSSTTSAIVKPADIDLNLIRKSNTTNAINSQMNPNPKQFSNNEINYSNTLNDNLNDNNNSDMESDSDITSPLKNNVNRNLSHEIENKTSKFWCSRPFQHKITFIFYSFNFLLLKFS